MKKIISMFLAVVLCCAVFIMPVSAANVPSDTDEIKVTSTKRINLSDGGYIIEEIIEYPAITRASGTKSGGKLSTRYTDTGKAIYGVRVDGTFSYNGTTSSATSSASTVYIYDSDASYVTKTAWRAGNTAYASGTVEYVGCVESRTVSISCDKNGNLS